MAQKPLSREQVEGAVRAVDEAGGIISHAAETLKIHRATLENRLRAARLQGLVPKPRRQVYATSTLVKGGDGDDFSLQWVKEKVDGRDFVAALADAIKAVKPLPPVKAPRITLADKLAVYPWGDPHFGQYSWAEETGDDYDLNIAQKLHFSAVDNLAARTAPAKQALLVSVGDTTHGDDSTNLTPASKHTLDVDTRWRKVLKTTVLTFERCVQRLLQRHEIVEVVIVAGNHDPHASAAIVLALEMLYRNNPRVTINGAPGKFLYRRFGSTLLGITHGDTCKLEKLGELMATDRAADWGQTQHRHWITGHWHHKKFFEGSGWSAEVLRTLAGKDAYAASHAYRSKRDMQSIVFDAVAGEYQRNTENICLLKEAA